MKNGSESRAPCIRRVPHFALFISHSSFSTFGLSKAALLDEQAQDCFLRVYQARDTDPVVKLEVDAEASWVMDQYPIEASSPCENGKTLEPANNIKAAIDKIFECQAPLATLGADLGSTLRVRFSVWRDGLPLDALPQEGAMDVHVAPETALSPLPYAKP